MDMVSVTGLVCTVVGAMLMWHLVEIFLLAVARGGEERVASEDGGGVVGGGGRIRRRRSEKRVRSDGVDERRRLVAERCEVVAEASSAAVVESFGNVVEEVGGDEGVECAAVVMRKSMERIVELDCGGDESGGEEKLEVEERLLLEDIPESGEASGLMEVEEIGGRSVPVDDCGVEFGSENVECNGRSELMCSADSGCVGGLFEENKGGEVQAMDVDDADGGEEEMEKELKDEVAVWIEECIRNIVGGVFEEMDSVNEGCEYEFEETAEPKDVADRIGGVIEEEHCVKEGYKNEFEEKEEPKDVNVEINDKVAEERFGSGEEDDDWEGIEMSELYNDFTAASALVHKEEKYGRLSNIGSEVKMQLYGLQKIVMEGPCREAQPMALKLSARAKWNAWQRLGNTNPEDAMKQYITLVSGIIPEWAEQNAGVDDQSENVEPKHISISDPDHSKPLVRFCQRKKELTHNAEDIDTGDAIL